MHEYRICESNCIKLFDAWIYQRFLRATSLGNRSSGPGCVKSSYKARHWQGVLVVWERHILQVHREAMVLSSKVCNLHVLQADRPEDYLWGQGVVWPWWRDRKSTNKKHPDLKIQKHLGNSGFLVVLKISRQLLLTTAIKSDGWQVMAIIHRWAPPLQYLDRFGRWIFMNIPHMEQGWQDRQNALCFIKAINPLTPSRLCAGSFSEFGMWFNQLCVDGVGGTQHDPMSIISWGSYGWELRTDSQSKMLEYQVRLCGMWTRKYRNRCGSLCVYMHIILICTMQIHTVYFAYRLAQMITYRKRFYLSYM